VGIGSLLDGSVRDLGVDPEQLEVLGPEDRAAVEADVRSGWLPLLDPGLVEAWARGCGRAPGAFRLGDLAAVKRATDAMRISEEVKAQDPQAWERARRAIDTKTLEERIQALDLPMEILKAVRTGKDRHGTPIRQTDILARLTRVLEDGSDFVLMRGGPGTGKSMAAGLWLAHRPGRWVSARRLAKLARSYKLEDGEPYRVCAALVVDELGLEDDRDAEVLVEVLLERYAQRRPTIATANMDAAAFGARYGDAVVRRLWAAGTILDAQEVLCPGQLKRDAAQAR
jgi:DNA replication protein DnaC